tara:strand:+ start:1702 stop:2046 length:345 start_codon:yes stop_codon:yes gene_type:complete
MNFKTKYSESERIQESKKIILKYPTRIPIIVEKNNDCDLEEINKKKYLVPRDMNLSQFVFVIRNRIKMEPSKALFIMINNSLAASGEIIGEIYDKRKDNDGFLYIIYTSENTFG